jgi:hypothetical protein
MRAVDPIGSRGKSMVQTALPVGRYAARTFRGRSNGYPRKGGSKPSDLCESSRALSGEPPEYLVMSERRDFAGSLNRFRSRGFAP